MKCQSCKQEFEEKLIQEHHIHPRFMDNKNGEGMKIQLCEKCHNILHLKISAIVYLFVDNKQECIEAVKKFTLNLNT